MVIIINLSRAVIDVCVDGLMVVQARRDLNTGSENLQTLSWACIGLGGIFGSILAGMAVTYAEGSHLFYATAIIGGLLFLIGLILPKTVEGTSHQTVRMSLCERTSHNFREIKQGFQIRELWRTLLFFMIEGAIVPSFTDYVYYYSQDVYGFTNREFSYLALTGHVTLFVGIMLYNKFLKEKPIRSMMVAAALVHCCGALLTMLYTR